MFYDSKALAALTHAYLLTDLSVTNILSYSFNE